MIQRHLTLALFVMIFAASACTANQTKLTGLATPVLKPDDLMTAHFINVGQANATLLEFSCGAILIDAGAQDDNYADHLISYLDTFFTHRRDLKRTLKSIIITHPHIDHTRALERIAQSFNVERFIDDGLNKGSGIEPIRWLRENARTQGRNIKVRSISEDEIRILPQRRGLSDQDIDPLACTPTNPKIALLSAGYTQSPGWTFRQFENANNQSLVVRVDFGKASFLFTGDLETPAIKTLVDYYRGTNTLDVDVYQVGHHGSHNGTTQALLDAMTPKAAVISAGTWNFGVKEKAHPYTTFKFGHPRKSLVEMLSRSIKETRSPVTQKVAIASKKFVDMPIKKAIYATPWDKDVRISASSSGKLDVVLGK